MGFGFFPPFTCSPRIFHPIFFVKYQLLGFFTPPDFSHLRLFAPKIIHTSDCSPPDYSHLGLFTPRIIPTLDFSHPALFTPRIVHTSQSTDYSPLYMRCSPLIPSFEPLTPCWTLHSYAFNISYSSFRDFSSFIIVETNYNFTIEFSMMKQ